ncbi:MAG: hypothetical protein QXS91_02065 [Candidatus Anstonellales archaeon]
MNQVFKYKKPLRLPIGDKQYGKRYLREDEAERLFSFRLIAEEKFDGTMHEIDTQEFKFYVEDMKYRKTIPYRIPARYAVFDILDKRATIFLRRDDKERLVIDIIKGRIWAYRHLADKLFIVPLIEAGKFSISEVPKLADMCSYYGHGKNVPIEGIVFKIDAAISILESYPFSAKYVRADFIDKINSSDKKISGLNVISSSIPMILSYKNQSAKIKNQIREP